MRIDLWLESTQEQELSGVCGEKLHDSQSSEVGERQSLQREREREREKEREERERERERREREKRETEERDTWEENENRGRDRAEKRNWEEAGSEENERLKRQSSTSLVSLSCHGYFLGSTETAGTLSSVCLSVCLSLSVYLSVSVLMLSNQDSSFQH